MNRTEIIMGLVIVFLLSLLAAGPWKITIDNVPICHWSDQVNCFKEYR